VGLDSSYAGPGGSEAEDSPSIDAMMRKAR
jgi:hypothetical protein